MLIEDCKWHKPGGVDAARAICAFLRQINIAVGIAPIEGETFVPGLAVVAGAIRVDPGTAAYPGDLLHEAGHIAVADPELRTMMSDVDPDPGEEMAAIAWSVAAANACNIPLPVLFHPAGYKGGSESLIENFSEGRTFGVPLLAWWGMTKERGEEGDMVFPAMKRWLR
jgi:hypothetical protein